jgi:hypothetical protein
VPPISAGVLKIVFRLSAILSFLSYKTSSKFNSFLGINNKIKALLKLVTAWVMKAACQE